MRIVSMYLHCLGIVTFFVSKEKLKVHSKLVLDRNILNKYRLLLGSNIGKFQASDAMKYELNFALDLDSTSSIVYNTCFL